MSYVDIPAGPGSVKRVNLRERTCIHLGQQIGRTKAVGCGSCSGGQTAEVPLRSCSKLVRCNATATYVPEVPFLHDCPHYEPNGQWLVDRPTNATLIDQARLRRADVAPDCYNASICRYQGRLLMAYRAGHGRARIGVVELGGDFQPIGRPVWLQVTHGASNLGHEDPRLFVFRDRLHCAFMGYHLQRGAVQADGCAVLYARLDDSLQVEKLYMPQYDKAQAWEKNWAFFEANGELFCVYTITPHVILRVDGDKAIEAYRIEWQLPGSVARGGASPVLHGDEFYNWYHGVEDVGQHRHYSVGLYTFDAQPPFAPRRYGDGPIARPTEAQNASGKPFILFPCGGVYEPPAQS